MGLTVAVKIAELKVVVATDVVTAMGGGESVVNDCCAPELSPAGFLAVRR